VNPIHAGLVAMRVAGRWSGALVTGPSGVGKSDLMLRCLDLGLRLVADDRTLVWRSDGRLFGRAPDAICGLFEARGVGVLAVPCLDFCEIRLLVVCEPADVPIERMPPQDDGEEVGGHRLPRLRLHPCQASAPAKLRLALARVCNHQPVQGL
jgi:serine kinase of HPr protein (carbohydrate metabolism regulator)